MNELFARLNSMERRLVVGLGVVLFIVINIVWVWPHFSDWSNLQYRLAKARQTLDLYNSAIQQKPKYQAEVDAMEKQGATVPPEDQSLEFLRTIQNEATRCGVNYTGNSRPTTHTNEFFLEQIQTITVRSREQQLVEFLHNLGAGESLIRVRDLSLRPNPPRQELNANLKLVASYQKNVLSRSAAVVAKSATAKPTTPIKR
ncbi:MAG TPA: hypothetical protein VKA67_06750 [Verrucomicrobiae bacterium]|nr:hypothetical protein [Verrucomicrobiae bacterium]